MMFSLSPNASGAWQQNGLWSKFFAPLKFQPAPLESLNARPKNQNKKKALYFIFTHSPSRIYLFQHRACFGLMLWALMEQEGTGDDDNNNKNV